MKKYTHLSKEERRNIYSLQLTGENKAEIARALSRDPSTIGREMIRNATLLSHAFNGIKQKIPEYYHYLPDTAEMKSEKRRKEVNWRAPLKNPETLSYTIKHLKL